MYVFQSLFNFVVVSGFRPGCPDYAYYGAPG